MVLVVCAASVGVGCRTELEKVKRYWTPTQRSRIHVPKWHVLKGAVVKMVAKWRKVIDGPSASKRRLRNVLLAYLCTSGHHNVPSSFRPQVAR